MLKGTETAQLHCPPFVLSEKLESRIIVLFLVRSQDDLHIYGGFHRETRKDILPVEVALEMHLQLTKRDNSLHHLQQNKVVIVTYPHQEYSHFQTFHDVFWSELSSTCPPRATVTLRPAIASEWPKAVNLYIYCS
jgi:hypothetical protein